MKKLSIEEKAQRYDEAIEKLRDFYRDYDTVSRLIDVKEELANLIPELKESESERVRKLTKKTSDEKHNLTEFENKLLDTCYGWLYCEASGCEKYIKESANLLLEIAVKKFNSIQTWSEEDERNLD